MISIIQVLLSKRHLSMSYKTEEFFAPFHILVTNRVKTIPPGFNDLIELIQSFDTARSDEDHQ